MTTAGVFGLNVLTGWDQRGRSGQTWHGLPCASMWGGSGRWGWLTSLTSRSRTNPPPASGKGAPKGTRSPPPPKAPRTATPAERAVRAEQAEPVAGRGQRGVVHEWVEQQRAGAWEARAINAEAANRDLEARLSRANEDRRDSESRLADVTKERDRLAAKVKTLSMERDLATSRKAKPAAQAAQAVERPEGAEAPPGERGGGAVPPVSATS